nr:hypothetical protein [Tanacetum cinerariifolium]
MVDDDDETSKDKEIDKLMALISLSFKKIYKPTNNNLQTSSNTSRANQDNFPRINRNAGNESQRIGNVAGARETKPKREKDASYHREKMLLCKQEEAGIQLNAEQADCKDDTDDESDDQKLEAHYMYMARVQEVSPDAVDSGPIFDTDPEQKIDQNDEDTDLAKERELLASLIEKLKCEINESKNRNKFLETSNKFLIDKLKSENKDFKNKNNSLELSNNQFKEANNKLSKENDLLYADFKKSQAELKRQNSIEYASEMEFECAKVREMKNKLSAHQDTISILKQQKDAQIKLYKTREDKELKKVIELENKVKVLDNIFYKTGQLVQTMNMLNNKCRTGFVKPEYLKKAKQANPRLYDIGCYNDNIALMLAPESDEKDQELEAHYMYMAKVQEVSPDAVDSGPIFDTEPEQKLVDIVLFIIDSGCSKHMTGNLKLLINFVEKFLGTVKFGNDQIAPILGYGDLSTCFIRDLKGNDLLSGSRGTDLYSIILQDTNFPNPICLVAKETSSQAWLWHRRLSHLNFDTINLLSKNDIVVGLLK